MTISFAIKDLWSGFLKTFKEQEIVPALAVFLLFVATAKLGQYIFFNEHTSPAIIWAPTGIALAAVYLRGYKMWLPIALAQLIVGLTNPVPLSLWVTVAATVGYTLQPLIGIYLLRRFGFDGKMERTRDALLLVAAAFLLPMFAPFVVSGAQQLAGISMAAWWESWSHNWAAGVLSILVLTPAITTWFSISKWEDPHLSFSRIFEIVLAFIVLVGWVYIVYWTTLPQQNVFLILYILLGILFWIGLRLGPGAMSLALLVNTGFGMAGSIIANPSGLAINQQLFADELFTILLAPIFLITSALVAERLVSEKKLQETINELQTALIRLEREDHSKNEFIAILAHELRNPLAPIVSTLEYLKLDERVLERTKMIESAEVQAQTMRRLLDDLLDVARVTQKKFKLVKEHIELAPILARSVSSTEHLVHSRRHTLTVSMPKEAIWLDADPVRLEQVVVNLINNSAKYTDEGGRIELSAKMEGGEVVIHVRDSGNGIPPGELKNIFLPFRQIKPNPKISTGLGIGLSLTKRLVEMHGGRIEAYSDGLGEGSTFTVRLPVSDVNSADKKPLPKNNPFNINFMNRLKILVVDDNELAAQGIGRLLEHKGHIVALAHNGRAALEAVVELSPEVMLLDIGLPDISGYEVASKIRESGNEEVTLIALTGYGQEEDKYMAQKAGFNYHLTKPVGIADIEKVLQSSQG